MTKTFTAQVAAFRDMTVKNMRYVASQSIQDVLEAAQTSQVALTKGATSVEPGKIPVADSGLINSLSVDGGTTGPDAYVAAITGFEIGDVMRFQWTAPYAMRIEVGHGTYPGAHFVGANAAKWPAFVAARVREVQK
jgi:hypothetical protein